MGPPVSERNRCVGWKRRDQTFGFCLGLSLLFFGTCAGFARGWVEKREMAGGLLEGRTFQDGRAVFCHESGDCYGEESREKERCVSE